MVVAPKDLAELSAQVNAARNNHAQVVTKFLPWVNEYNMRLHLKDLGFTSSFDDLSPQDAEIFMRIGAEYRRLDKQAADRKTAQR